MKTFLNILVPVLICSIVGTTASLFQSDSIQAWYPYLDKSSLTPPNFVFPIAWGILYLLMGISLGLILNSNVVNKRNIVSLFILQLVLNFSWSISFFYLHNPLLGLVNIILLDLVVLIYIIKVYGELKISSYLFFPYLLWLLFATYLNAYIVYCN